jgi:hypothetical protein
VSHDLRAPLRVVDGFATIVLEDYGDRGKPLDDLGREHLRRIVAAGQRMNTMIDTLLNLSRMTSRELARERVDLSQIARELVDDLRAQDATRAVEFVVAAGLKADGDPTLLRLVLQNLLGNAYKFSARNRGARIEFGCRDDGERVWLVRDNRFRHALWEKMFGLFSGCRPTSSPAPASAWPPCEDRASRSALGEAIPPPPKATAQLLFTLWEGMVTRWCFAVAFEGAEQRSGGRSFRPKSAVGWPSLAAGRCEQRREPRRAPSQARLLWPTFLGGKKVGALAAGFSRRARGSRT